jgi:hypothetical protein
MICRDRIRGGSEHAPHSAASVWIEYRIKDIDYSVINVLSHSSASLTDRVNILILMICETTS